MAVGTYLRVSGEALDQACKPVDLLENDQTLPSFTVVVRLLLVLALKEQSKKIKVGRLGPKQGIG